MKLNIEINNLEKIPIFSLQLKNYNTLNTALILNELNILCKSSTFYCDRFLTIINLIKIKVVKFL